MSNKYKMLNKIKKIEQLYKEGKIKKLGNNCYSVPFEYFVLGITSKMINEILKKPNLKLLVNSFGRTDYKKVTKETEKKEKQKQKLKDMRKC